MCEINKYTEAKRLWQGKPMYQLTVYKCMALLPFWTQKLLEQIFIKDLVQKRHGGLSLYQMA